MEFNKNKLRIEIKNKLSNNISKADIYNELKTRYKDVKQRKKLANLIRFSHEKWRIKKYGIYNNLFLILLSIIVLMNILTLSIGGIIWFSVLLFIVAKKLTQHYIWISVIGGIIIISGILLQSYNYFEGKLNPIFAVSGSIIVGVIFILVGYLIPKYLTPNYELIEEIIVDAEGRKRKRKRIYFK